MLASLNQIRRGEEQKYFSNSKSFLKVKTTPDKKKGSQKMNNNREESMHIEQRMADYRQF